MPFKNFNCGPGLTVETKLYMKKHWEKWKIKQNWQQ